MPRHFALLPTLLLLLGAGCPLRPPVPDAQQQPARRLPENVDRRQVAQDNVRLGLAYLQGNDLEKAQEKMLKAVEADSSYPPAHLALGLLYERVGERAKAEQHLLQTLRLDPKNSDYRNAYGQFLCGGRKTQEGLKYLLDAATDPIYNNPQIPYHNAGLCALSTGEHEDAEHFFRQALQSNPQFAPSLLEMSQLRYQADNALSARAYLQRYEEAAARTPRSLLLGICIEGLLGDKNQLASYKIQLRNQHPDSNEAALLEQGRCP